MTCLPEPARALLRMRYTEGLASTEVARRTGRTRAWVRVRLHRIRAELRTCLTHQGVQS